MHEGILFWNVDTQIDFIEPTGKLYVKGAEKLKPVLKKNHRFCRREPHPCDQYM